MLFTIGDIPNSHPPVIDGNGLYLGITTETAGDNSLGIGARPDFRTFPYYGYISAIVRSLYLAFYLIKPLAVFTLICKDLSVLVAALLVGLLLQPPCLLRESAGLD